MSRARVSEWEFAVFMRKNVRGTRADVLFSNERRDRGTRTREKHGCDRVRDEDGTTEGKRKRGREKGCTGEGAERERETEEDKR